MPTFGILTSSDLGAQGRRQDTSGQRIREMLEAAGFEISRYEVVPDEQPALEERLRLWSDKDGLDLIVTTGGTGLTDRDVTPEATRAVIGREVPGMAEAMRIQTLQHTPLSMVSRAVVGIRGRTLIVNLPGSPKAVQECLEVVLPAIPHALEMLQDKPPTHEAQP
ncbi:MAG: MogA/MoaB family molybdenum cofactor biosynthesis protein [Dehalococcoidia bacterium]